MTARAQRIMLNEMKKNPRVSARDLKKSLAHADISVDESTIRVEVGFPAGFKLTSISLLLLLQSCQPLPLSSACFSQ
ncbi:hypothetical protein JOQ06_008913, partial [Pogonophryne albipinna]